MKVYYYTFGCKVNQYETENLKQRFEGLGYDTVLKTADADICIINSCTVTSSADSKAMKLIRRMRKENPEAGIVLTGCFPQAFPEEAEALAECDIIVGASEKNLIPQLVGEFLAERKRIVRISPHKKGEKIEEMSNGEVASKTRAYVKIQDGCDRYCSYCIIPYARGNIRSKPIEQLKDEIAHLADADHKEVILTGINLCRYGKDFGDGTGLVDAVRAACSVGEIERVRLSSLEPELISDSDIEALAALEKLCPHFHLSLQSGCDKTLKAMNRRYTTAEYKSLCDKLREKFPGCAITTDIMVGFPGETEEDFRISAEFVRSIGFARSHIFPYSPRKGTAAAGRSDQIDGRIKERRAAEMEAVCSQSEKEFLKSMVGKRVRVLFEKENSSEFHQGYSENYTQIKIPRKNSIKSLRRMIFYVIIKEYGKNYCLGEISE